MQQLLFDSTLTLHGDSGTVLSETWASLLIHPSICTYAHMHAWVYLLLYIDTVLVLAMMTCNRCLRVLFCCSLAGSPPGPEAGGHSGAGLKVQGNGHGPSEEASQRLQPRERCSNTGSKRQSLGRSVHLHSLIALSKTSGSSEVPGRRAPSSLPGCLTGCQGPAVTVEPPALGLTGPSPPNAPVCSRFFSFWAEGLAPRIPPRAGRGSSLQWPPPWAPAFRVQKTARAREVAASTSGALRPDAQETRGRGV